MTDLFTTPPREPDPGAALSVDAIRGRVAQLAAAQADQYRRYEREQRVRKLCERNWDLAFARQVVAELDKG